MKKKIRKSLIAIISIQKLVVINMTNNFADKIPCNLV